MTAIQPAIAVWTSEEEYNDSYINTWLNEYFWNSLDNGIQSNILNNTFNIGIYGETEEEQNVSEITTTKKIGLLDAQQYIRAGSANSFLDIENWWWLGNRYDSLTGICSVHSKIYNNGSSYSYYGYGVRPVIKIMDLDIAEGDGTLVNSYRTVNKATNTSNVQIGEYINVPYNGTDNACGSDNMCTFRVVSKDSDSIKLVLNGLLPNASTYGTSATITINNTIYEVLNDFVEGISDTYRYIGNKIFYIGDYPYVEGVGQDYKDIKDETFESSMGLPAVGEMFSGNDINLGTSSVKIFVDVNTIENPIINRYHSYWLINRYDLNGVRSIYYNGDLYRSDSNARGVRPVIYLKSGTSSITFTEGEGTAQSPYVLQ